jgi:hypothetical protein
MTTDASDDNLESHRGIVRRVPEGVKDHSGDLDFSADYTVTSTTDNGGKVLPSVEVILCFWGSFWSSTPPPTPSADEYKKAFSGILTGPYMRGLRQYRGVAQGTVIYSEINSDSSPADLYTDADVVAMLTDRIQNHGMPAPTVGHDRLYAVIAPQGIRNSITKYAGQHQTFTVNGVTGYYAWVDNTGSLTGHDASTKVFSHELVEACTDPGVDNSGIMVNGTDSAGKPVTNDEIGDTCNNQYATVTINGVTCSVQAYWSKADNACVLPLGTLSFWVDKSSFGRDEVKDFIDTNGGVVSNAFWLVLEDFSPNTFQSFGVQIPVPTGSFTSLPGVTITPSPAMPGDTPPAQATPVYEDSAHPDAIQRIRFSFDIRFTNALLTASPSPFPASGASSYALNGSIVINGSPLPGAPSTAATVFELVSGADPYFTNIDPTNQANDVSWLSQDLRVFPVAVGQSALPGDASAPVFQASQSSWDYIQALLSYLNGSDAYTTPVPPGSPDPLNGLRNQSGYETGDSSVTPLNAAGQRNSNFAIARVRLRTETQGAAGEAADARVFFRLWVAASCDTDFQPDSTYPSNPPAPSLPRNPLPSAANLPPDPFGNAIQTIPYFATDASGSNDYNSNYAGANNIRTLQVPVTPGRDSVWAYYGCFLDVYDTANNSKFPGTHHCIVAQIAYDQAPIVNPSGITLSPSSTDKLAQRNLQITPSGNPGPASTHRIPQAFDLRPTAPPLGAPGAPQNQPDELMIDWGNTPVGSTAQIYWPQVNASEVLNLAASVYRTHLLSATDAHTLQLKTVNGVSYVPIPAGTTGNLSGLFTVDLPLGISSGQEFNITVRRIKTRQLPSRIDLPAQDARSAVAEKGQYWRYNAGTFQVRIPVTTEERMLVPEENTLAILKWRLEHMAPTYRWYPVVQRYIDYVASRVDGCGGNAGLIEPSPLGVPLQSSHVEVEFTGKVCEVVYDCFGEFTGFALVDCSESYSFISCERAISEVVLRALQNRLTLTVVADGSKRRKIRRLIIRD